MMKLNKIALSLFLLIGNSFGLICSDEEDNEVAEINRTAIFQSVSPSATWDRCTPLLLKSCLRKKSKYGETCVVLSEEKGSFTVPLRYPTNYAPIINSCINGRFTDKSLNAIQQAESKKGCKVASCHLATMKSIAAKKRLEQVIEGIKGLSKEEASLLLEQLKKQQSLRTGTSKK